MHRLHSQLKVEGQRVGSVTSRTRSASLMAAITGHDVPEAIAKLISGPAACRSCRRWLFDHGRRYFFSDACFPEKLALLNTRIQPSGVFRMGRAFTGQSSLQKHEWQSLGNTMMVSQFDHSVELAHLSAFCHKACRLFPVGNRTCCCSISLFPRMKMKLFGPHPDRPAPHFGQMPAEPDSPPGGFPRTLAAGNGDFITVTLCFGRFQIPLHNGSTSSFSGRFGNTHHHGDAVFAHQPSALKPAPAITTLQPSLQKAASPVRAADLPPLQDLCCRWCREEFSMSEM